jgi:hypothetical protein
MNDYNYQEIQMKEILTYTMNTIYKEPQNALNQIIPPPHPSYSTKGHSLPGYLALHRGLKCLIGGRLTSNNQNEICVKFDPFPETTSISQLKILEKYMRFKGGGNKGKIAI